MQDLLIDEGVAAIDALSRATLLQLLRNLGPLALPLTLPLNFLLGGGNPQRILSREARASGDGAGQTVGLQIEGWHDECVFFFPLWWDA